jgi:succinyl-diaminopimelate desuccinylase
VNHLPDAQKAVELTRALIQRPSITPDDHGCQQLIETYLKPLGFEFTAINSAGVSNLWAQRGNHPEYFVFAGHTDVVPTGPIEQWTFPPFDAKIHNELLYGRGASDMKSSIAAMLIAMNHFITRHDPNFSLAMAITSDEEGPATDGTIKICDHLRKKQIQPTWCLIGEPSSENQLGDTIKVGRRGSLHANLRIIGTQGHIAYPDRANNPIPKALQALDALCQTTWDQGCDTFPPSTMQISNIQSGTGALNVTPGDICIQLNFRHGSISTQESLKRRTEAILARHQIKYETTWKSSAEPFGSLSGLLRQSVTHAIWQGFT